MEPAHVITRHLRNTELLLLVMAFAVAALARINVDLGAIGQIAPDSWAALAWLAVVSMVSHVAVRRFAAAADPLILPIMVGLLGLGVAEIHRLDLVRAHPTTVATSQMVWASVGVVALVATLIGLPDHRALGRYPYLGIAVSVAALAVPALLPSRFSEVNGAKIWVRLGGFSVQPGEFAKLLLIASISSYLVLNRDALVLLGRRFLGLALPRARHLGPLLVTWAGALLLLVFEHDVGMSILFLFVFIAMLYVATERVSWVVIGSVLGLGGGYIAQLLLPHVHQRIEIWLHPFSDPQGAGYQVDQAMYGLANGGLLGAGLGRGRPQLVPFANSDFIMSSLGEEIGLAGLFSILACYLILVERGLRAAAHLSDTFGKLLASGLSFGVALQVFIIVGGVTHLIPLTGLTTPYMSYGGSSLVASWLLGALLIRLSDSAQRNHRPGLPRTIGDDSTQLLKR